MVITNAGGVVDRSEMKEKFRETNALKGYLAGNTPNRDFYDLSYACIIEVFGQPTKEQFEGNSHMAIYFASKQNIIREILRENNRLND